MKTIEINTIKGKQRVKVGDKIKVVNGKTYNLNAFFKVDLSKPATVLEKNNKIYAGLLPINFFKDKLVEVV